VALSVDPALALAARLALALLFAHAAWHKLSDLAAFRAALAGYRLLPERALGVAAPALVALELGTGLGLVASRAGGALALGLLALYTLAIGANLARGRREIDCGCFGPAARQPLSAGLVWRNLGLLAVAALAGAPPATRALSWVDALSIAGGVAFAALAFASVNALFANAPRLRALRGG
jgi:hypothetical protein